MQADRPDLDGPILPQPDPPHPPIAPSSLGVATVHQLTPGRQPRTILLEGAGLLHALGTTVPANVALHQSDTDPEQVVIWTLHRVLEHEHPDAWSGGWRQDGLRVSVNRDALIRALEQTIPRPGRQATP